MSITRPEPPGTRELARPSQASGQGTHTEQEWIDADPVATGLAALAATVARLDEQEW
jgi:hypothetical protein